MLPLALFSKDCLNPFFRLDSRAIDHMVGLAVDCLRRCLDPKAMGEKTRVSMLAKLIDSRDDSGELLGRDELITEALTFLVTSSNSTAITLAVTVQCVASTPGVMKQRQKAVDKVVPARVYIPIYKMAKSII